MIRLDAATVLLQWATGGLLFLWVTAEEKGLLGSRRTGTMTNMGRQARSITGISMVCVSRVSVQAAPMAMNSEPNINTASVWKNRNQASSAVNTDSRLSSSEVVEAAVLPQESVEAVLAVLRLHLHSSDDLPLVVHVVDDGLVA